jgi:hypothetical protein
VAWRPVSRRHAVDVTTCAEYRGLSRVDGQGGFFVPPVWLVSQFVELARSGRAYADLVTSQPLPSGTDSISIPRSRRGPRRRCRPRTTPRWPKPT